MWRVIVQALLRRIHALTRSKELSGTATDPNVSKTCRFSSERRATLKKRWEATRRYWPIPNIREMVSLMDGCWLCSLLASSPRRKFRARELASRNSCALTASDLQRSCVSEADVSQRDMDDSHSEFEHNQRHVVEGSISGGAAHLAGTAGLGNEPGDSQHL